MAKKLLNHKETPVFQTSGSAVVTPRARWPDTTPTSLTPGKLYNFSRLKDSKEWGMYTDRAKIKDSSEFFYCYKFINPEGKQDHLYADDDKDLKDWYKLEEKQE
jgi:hypothetical protein